MRRLTRAPRPAARAVCLAALPVVAACGQGDARTDTPAPPRGGAGATAGAAVPTGGGTPVRVASRPADDCGWIPAAEVAAIVGPLTGTPRPSADGCVYPVPLGSTTARRRARAAELARRLEERFGPSDVPKETPEESAVIVRVEVNPNQAADRLAGEALATFARRALGGAAADGAASGGADSTRPARALPAGWDGTIGVPATFAGRVGHLGVMVTVRASAVSRDQAVALAARVRDRIPDLPFAVVPGEAASPASGAPVGRDPCSLLTAQEAEAVLGRLVVPPYRSHERTPLAERGGRSCAYYTAGHHALVLTPVWDYAGGGVEAIHTAGGLLSTLVPGGTDAVADTLDGDWDEVGTDRTTGELYFLMGDRLLALDYLASSTDADGAIRLAKIATERLGRGDTKQPRAAPGAGAVSSRCPAAADVGAAVGFPTTAVRAEDGGPHWVTCVYELTGRYRGVFVEIKTEPVSRAETRFAELRQRVKRARGQDAEPDRIAVGDGGWAYGSGAGSQAAAVAGDHVHRATMEYFGYGSIGDQKDAMVRVLRLATR